MVKGKYEEKSRLLGSSEKRSTPSSSHFSHDQRASRSLPSIRSRDALLLLAHSSFLVPRTVLSVAVAKLNVRIVRDLVSADGDGFLRGWPSGFVWLCQAYTPTPWSVHPPPTSAIALTYPPDYLQSKLSLRFRDRLTRYVHDLYFSAPYLAITASLSRASTSTSQPMLKPAVKVWLLAYSTSHVIAVMSHALTHAHTVGIR